MAEVQSIIVSEVEYRDIPGFPGYRVGNDGSVWSCRERRPARGPGAKGSVSHIGDVWKPLAPARHKFGYPTVSLNSVTVGMKYKTFLVHRLVLTMFVGPCPPGMECCHDPDRDPANCRLSNLRWDTVLANANDRVRHGTRCKGELVGTSKLTMKGVLEIRANSKPNQRNKIALSKKYGVSKSAIERVVARKTWSHV